MWFGIVFGFGIFVGALVVLGIEAIIVLAVIERLSQKSPSPESRNDQLDHNQSLDFSFNKQGVLWVLLSSKVPKDWLDDGKAPKEQKRKKAYFEVTPVKKQAKINGQTLVLTESDGSKSILKLKGCTIETVSASHLSSRKWAKRFPLKLENKVSAVYKECKTLYIFLETSWEKESWCKALRLASSENRSRLEWSVKLQKEFRNYLTSLNDGYPSFMKPSSGLYATELSDRTQRNDGSSSKVRTLWKKFAKKASKNGTENRASWPSLSYVEKMGENGLSVGLSKNPSPAESARHRVEDSDAVLPKLTHSMSQGQVSCVSDAETEERFGIIDEGTLCWNLLISRLFFDSKKNGEMRKSLQARIQRTMSNMRTPSYIREVICTDIDLGNLPPYIHGMRVLPMDTNEVWAFELDVEYAGSLVLGIETRLEVCELDSERTIVDPDSEPNSVEDVTSELLEGFEYLGKQLDLSEGTATGGSEHKEEGEHKLDRSKSSKASSTYRSRWKSIVNNIAKQVSQVPISLTVRISSLRGTLRVHIKPPPSDQLWFGFTSMPDIDFNLDSAVGDHKITNGQIALFIINRLKGAINETLVLPNCECVGIPFMLAEKDDWVPRKVAPFIWVHRDTPNDSANSRDPLIDHLCEAKPKTEQEQEKEKEKEEATRQVVQSVSGPSESKPLLSNGTLEDLKEHLLESNHEEESEGSESHKVSGDSPECQSTSRSLVFFDKPPLALKDDAAKPRKMGTRERMFEYRKKVSDKLEEKRRQMEEKSKQIVDKMRGT